MGPLPRSNPPSLRARLLAVLVVLAAIDLAVRLWFVPGFVHAYYVAGFATLRDRTAGQNFRVLYDALGKRVGSALRVATVGDSTMNSVDAVETTMIPYQLETELCRAYGAGSFRVIDFSVIGLYATDAALTVNKLMAADVDVIVYGVQFRAFPRRTGTFATRIGRQQSAADLARCVSAGGSRLLWETANPDDLFAGLVGSVWATYTYHPQLKLWLWGALQTQLKSYGIASGPALAPPASAKVSASPIKPRSVDWSSDEYSLDNPNWDGLETIGRLCAQHPQTACVLYAGPVNPIGRDRVTDPGLFEGFLARVQHVAESNQIVWRDYTTAMSGDDFQPPKFGKTRDPIHLNPGGRAKMAALLLDPIEEALAKRARERR